MHSRNENLFLYVEQFSRARTRQLRWHLLNARAATDSGRFRRVTVRLGDALLGVTDMLPVAIGTVWAARACREASVL